MTHHPPAPRDLEERRQAALNHLTGNTQLWLTTGSDGHGAHLIPVAYVWDGIHITMATFTHSRTAANLRANPRARVAIGDPSDLVMIDGQVTLLDPTHIDPTTAEAYARISFDPRTLPGLTYLTLRPTRMQTWNGFHEFHHRTIMTNGHWLNTPTESSAGLPAWIAA